VHFHVVNAADIQAAHMHFIAASHKVKGNPSKHEELLSLSRGTRVFALRIRGGAGDGHGHERHSFDTSEDLNGAHTEPR
jgi:hypothetical protein